MVFGVSPDSVASHKNFKEKHNLSVMLLSDPEHRVLEAYGARGTRKMCGKESAGVIRSSVLTDPEGTVRRVMAQGRVFRPCARGAPSLDGTGKVGFDALWGLEKGSAE